jgi:TetR/AcrR family transcriptional repressor of uid operon
MVGATMGRGRESREETTLDTRDRLLKAAVEVFVEKGYAGGTLQDVARRADLTTGAVYSNFGGKADLLMEALVFASTHAYDTVGTSRLGDQVVTIDDFVDIWVEALYSPAAPVHRLILEAWVATAHDPDAHDAFFEQLATSNSLFKRGMQRSREQGLLADEIDNLTVLAFGRAIVMGAQASKALGLPLPSRVQAKVLLRRIAEAFRP